MARKDKVLFPMYETVTQVALEKLFEKLPQKFYKRLTIYPTRVNTGKRPSLIPKWMYLWNPPI